LEELPLHLGNNTENCKSCFPLIGFKLTYIVIVGSLVGLAALQVVESPPGTLLIEQYTKHDEDTTTILEKLNNIEENIVAIKKNLIRVNKHLDNEKL